MICTYSTNKIQLTAILGATVLFMGLFYAVSPNLFADDDDNKKAKKLKKLRGKVVTLEDDEKGNTKGWNPDGSKISFFIMDKHVKPQSQILASVVEPPGDFGTSCFAISVTDGQFTLSCGFFTTDFVPDEDSTLTYAVINP